MMQELLFYAVLPSGVRAQDVRAFLSHDGQSIIVQIFWPEDSVMLNPMQRWNDEFPAEGITNHHHALVSYMEQINRAVLQQGDPIGAHDRRTIRSTFSYPLGTTAEQPSNFQEQICVTEDPSDGANYVIARLTVMRTNVRATNPIQFSVPRQNS